MYKVTQYSLSMTRGVMADAICPQKLYIEKEKIFEHLDDAKKYLSTCDHHASLIRLSDGAELICGCWDI